MKRTLLSIKTRAITSLVILMITLPMWGNDGDTFTAETVEGVMLTYTVISESDKTCMVGEEYYPAEPTTRTDRVRKVSESKPSGDITILEVANGYAVIRIEAFAFKNSAITSVVIPSCVKTIGVAAFSGCVDLKSVTLPNQLSTIEGYTFSGCENLNNIDIPESVTCIGEYAFANCKQLREIVIPNTVTNFGNDVFWNTGFTSLPKLPESLTTIPNGMFYECTQLTSIELPQNITRIGDTAFGRCPIFEIEIPASITHIGVAAFANCKNLTNIVIPDNVMSIGMNGFLGCSGLKVITLSNNLSSLSKGVFCDCTSLESITIPSGVKTIGEIAFLNCSSLTTISIPETVESIDNRAFYGCSSLKKLFIPKSVISIDTKTDWALLYACNSLTSIIVDENNPVYDSRNNCNAIIETASNKIIVGCTTTTIPEGITAIGYYAFSGLENLTAITLPQSLESIETGAFCKLGIHEISIPENVKSIASYAFNSCKQLETVKTYIKEPIKIPENAFSWGSSTATLYVPQGTVGKYKAAKGWNVFSSIKENTSSQIEINEQNFPDENFRNWVLSQEYGADGVLTSEELKNVTSLNISRLDIHNQKGIEYFTALKVLNCMTNKLTTLDLSKNTALEKLECVGNRMTTINLQENKELRFLNCGGNNLTTLDISGCTKLDTLACSGNQLTALDVSKNTKLTCLECQGNQLSSLDLSKNTTLRRLHCNSNKLSTLDVSKNMALTLLQCSDNLLTTLDVTKNSALTSLSCTDNKLTSLYVSNNISLEWLSCFNNQLTSLDVSGCSSLKSLGCNSNQITTLSLSGCSAIMFLDCCDNQLSTLDLSENTALTTLYCLRNQIKDKGMDALVEGLPTVSEGSLYVMYFENEQNAMTITQVAAAKAKGWTPYRGAYDIYEEYVGTETPQIAYRPFIEEGKVWKVGGAESGNPVQFVEYLYFDGDTIIGGKTCKQMMRQVYYGPNYPDLYLIDVLPPLEYVGAWYEEDKKVYEYNTTDKQFKLMYDFSADANDTIQINNCQFVIGPKQIGGIKGFKGVYQDVRRCESGGSSYSPTWMEGVGSIDAPTKNVYYVDEVPTWFLMSCTVGDEVIYLNDEYEDGATPLVMETKKVRFDFTHTVKTQPKAPIKRETSDAYISSSEREVVRSEVKAPKKKVAEKLLYGEYNAQQLDINLDPLDDAYQVRITDASGKAVYEKSINAGNIVGLNIDISSYTKGLYTVTVENSQESFTGEFNANTTGIEEVGSKRSEVSGHYIYNLQGQRISSLRKGLNIVNGQKVYVK